MGRHIPELGYLNLLLGVEPVLSPEERFYQRLIALDCDEAQQIAETHMAAHGIASTFDDVILPALTLLETDRRKNALEPARERYVYEHTRRIIEELEHPAPADTGSAVCIVPARDETDHVAAMMVGRLVAGEVLDKPPSKQCKAILISAVQPGAAHDAGYLARRLRREAPNAKIVVGLWSGDNNSRARERLQKLGVDQVITHVAEAAELLRRLTGSAPSERMRAGMARELPR
jgi:glycerophosphoryl diester phosphodiesterase